MNKYPRWLVAIISACFAIVLLASCSNSSSATATGGEELTVGVSLSTAQNTTIQAVADGIAAEIEAAGGDVITADGDLSIDKQIADIDQFITQQVDAIVVIPLDFPTLENALRRADEAGIAVFAHDALMEDATEETLDPVKSQVLTGRAEHAEKAADFFAERVDGSGEVAAIGIAAPVNTNIYLLDQFEHQLSERDDLTFVGEKGNPSDDAAGARGLAQDFITQYPDVEAIFTYNDPSAVGAATAAQAAGKDDQIIVTGFNASQDGLDAVKSGAVDATWDYKPVEIGQTLGRLLITSVIEEQPIELTYTMDVEVVTQENVDEFVPWEERVESIREGEYLGLPVE